MWHFVCFLTASWLSTHIKSQWQTAFARSAWPRGELGSLPADSEQFMLIEHMAGQIEKIQEQLEAGMHNKVNIEFLSKQVEKVLLDVEKLKDKIRANGSTH